MHLREDPPGFAPGHQNPILLICVHPIHLWFNTSSNGSLVSNADAPGDSTFPLQEIHELPEIGEFHLSAIRDGENHPRCLAVRNHVHQIGSGC